MREKTNIEAAIKYLRFAKNLLESEAAAERNKGQGRTNWGRVETLNHFVNELAEILSSDHGESGLEPYYKFYEKNRKGV